MSTPGGVEYGGNGTQTSEVWDVGVPTHWSGAGNGGTGGDRGLYRPLSEHGCAIHCDPSYHGLVFGGGAESRNLPIWVMVGSARPGYYEDKGRTGIHGGGGGGNAGWVNCRWGERESRSG